MKSVKFKMLETEFTYEVTNIDGRPALKATYIKDGELHVIYTHDADILPQSEEEADEFLNGLDWKHVDV